LPRERVGILYIWRMSSAAARAGLAVARSLREAALAPRSIGVLDLSKSEALTCKNVMCANFPGGSCVCRLAKFLWDQPLENVHTLDLSSNNLDTVPDTVFSSLPALRYVPPCVCAADCRNYLHMNYRVIRL
jgi:hypothetical protein